MFLLILLTPHLPVRADAHFSRAHITVDNSQHFFQCGHTALAQGKNSFPSRCYVLVRWSKKEEHTPINLPDSHRSFQCRDDATIISTTEDPEGFPHSGASSSSKQTAACSVPTMLGSSGASLWKQWRDRESVDSPKAKRNRDQNVVHSLRDRENLKKILERKVDPAVEGEWLSKNCMKLRLKLRQETGRREILTSVFMRSIKNLNLNDYIKQVDRRIRLRETKSACFENWN